MSVTPRDKIPGAGFTDAPDGKVFEGTVPRKIVGFCDNGNVMVLRPGDLTAMEMEMWAMPDGSPVFRRKATPPIDQLGSDKEKLSTRERWQRTGQTEE